MNALLACCLQFLRLRLLVPQRLAIYVVRSLVGLFVGLFVASGYSVDFWSNQFLPMARAHRRFMCRLHDSLWLSSTRRRGRVASVVFTDAVVVAIVFLKSSSYGTIIVSREPIRFRAEEFKLESPSEHVITKA